MSDFPLQAILDFALATSGDPAVSRELAKGLDPNQEEYAYKHVCGRVERRDERRALRIVGLLAAGGIPHNGEVTFGAWCSQQDSDAVERRLLAMQNLPFDQAVKEIRRVMAMSGKNPGAFNWYGLAQTLYYWGNRPSEKTREVRLRILSDFYRARPKESGKSKES